jgi:hypothetical protein
MCTYIGVIHDIHYYYYWLIKYTNSVLQRLIRVPKFHGSN